MLKQFKKELAKFQNSGSLSYFLQGRKGIEKENLRVDKNGKLSQKSAPKDFGSALSHSYITKDFAEAMSELVTPPYHSLHELFEFLKNLHGYSYRCLKSENFWVASMPDTSIDAIPIQIAQFGKSNKAKLKETYRKGLRLRYGEKMQMISGMHFNYSFHPKVWQQLGAGFNKKNAVLFGVARNFLRYQWLLTYLLGASPIADKKIPIASHYYQSKEFPFATSLRQVGYRNKENVNVSYNSVEEYLLDLSKITKKKEASFEKIGIKKGENYLQLNGNRIQIENEFYAPIRPKPEQIDSKRPLFCLQKNGVDYFELRCLDLQPLSPLGLELEQACFLELVMIFCLLLPSPMLEKSDWQELNYNQETVCLRGREAKLLLQRNGKKQPLKSWGEEIFACLKELIDFLANTKGVSLYKTALLQQQKILEEPDKSPSARILAEMKKENLSYHSYILKKSEKHKSYFLKQPLKKEFLELMLQEKKSSLQETAAIEKKNKISFAEFLKDYLQ